MLANYNFLAESKRNKSKEIYCLLYERVMNVGDLNLLLDLTINPQNDECAFKEEINKFNYPRITFPHQDLEGVAELLLIKFNKDSVKDLNLLKLSVEHSLDEISPESLKTGNGRMVCAWINSSLNLEDLGKEISHSAIQQVSCGSNVIFRFYDPGVFGNIDSFLDSWQTKRLLKNITSWFYINGDGELLEKSGGSECLHKLDFSLGITNTEWTRMHYISLVNKILLCYRDKKRVARISEKQAWQCLVPALDFYLNLYSLDERVVSFGVDVLNFLPGFHEENSGSNMLQKISEKKELHAYFKSMGFYTY